MAVADASGLMDIASTLAQDEIPFKLRCAICNNLAVNAFRLPCCDQSICETCQSSLSNTCPVCTHTPVSPDLCKPNKALRTTLKAFLRTEEKKRRDRQSAATPSNATPTDTNAAEVTPQIGESTAAEKVDAQIPAESTESKNEVPEVIGPAGDAPATYTGGENASEELAPNADVSGEAVQIDAAGNEANSAETALEPAAEHPAADSAAGEPAPAQDVSGDPNSTQMPNMGANFQMGWNGNAMNPYMAGMFGFPQSMGMSMGMGPMADQGMFGDYGMNMTGMGMNSGNYNGGMYGSLGWDGSQNSNMWQGGQDNYNPNAFANGTGPYAGTFGGSNMSAYPSSDYQSGYYGSNYGRGGFRGRGRGQNHGFGRGYAPAHGHYRANSGYSNVNAMAEGSGDQGNSLNGVPGGESGSGNPDSSGSQAIPTTDDQSIHGSNGLNGHPPGPGVEGAPAAPRAMRQGLPNTSVFRQRGFQPQGRASYPGEPDGPSNVTVPVSQSNSRSGSPHPDPRPRSPSVHGTEDDRDSRRAEPKRMDRVDELQSDARRTRSPSRTSSHRSSRRSHHDGERDKDRKDSHRSQRSRRHRSYSRSSSQNGGSRSSARQDIIAENTSNGRSRLNSEVPESRDLASRVSSSRRSEKDRVSRRENDRSRGENGDSRRRDRDRRDRDRDTDRDRRRDRNDRVTDRDRDRRDRPRERERDRKRSRRDRSQSVNGSGRPQSQRVKREDRTRENSTDASAKKPEPEKDPYTIEREARNKERMQREQQHREKASSGRRRDSRQDRVVAGRRINYKYEDEL